MSRYPLLYQLNTRVRMSELAERLGRSTTLDDIPDAELDQLSNAGFELLWLTGCWQTGEASRRVSLSNPAWREEFERVLPDLRESDVCGSCFAVREYRVHSDFGGDEALARLRARLRARGMRLLLDFVPNHVALDHPWIYAHRDFFIEGTVEDLAAHPDRYVRIETKDTTHVLAMGRDPYFAGWPDTLQLNYGNPALQAALRRELQHIARQCDGVRCDMAMLMLPEVFQKTWGIVAEPFWPYAIEGTRAVCPGFLFIAEAYWDLEWTLQRQGFDYAYDKRLYDRLAQGVARPVREHLQARIEYQAHLARFLENHDEPRAAATFALEMHRAAAAITFFTPGLRFFHQGQREGKHVHIPTHLARGPKEACDAEIALFYDQLWKNLKDPIFHKGSFELLGVRQAWEGNVTHDAFVCFAWSTSGGERRLITVNYAPHQSQCYVALSWPELSSARVILRDTVSDAVYERNGAELCAAGLYLDVSPWRYHIFRVDPMPREVTGSQP